jgi:uncharacterized membrane protein
MSQVKNLISIVLLCCLFTVLNVATPVETEAPSDSSVSQQTSRSSTGTIASTPTGSTDPVTSSTGSSSPVTSTGYSTPNSAGQGENTSTSTDQSQLEASASVPAAQQSVPQQKNATNSTFSPSTSHSQTMIHAKVNNGTKVYVFSVLYFSSILILVLLL